MQLVGQVTDPVGQLARVLLHQRQHLHGVAVGGRGLEAGLEAGDHDRQGRDPLAHIVMEIAGDAAALGFLRRDQPAEEIGDLAVAGLERRVVVEQRRLDAPPPGALDQQSGDERGLQQHQHQRRRDVGLVPIPQGRVAKHDRGAGRHAGRR